GRPVPGGQIRDLDALHVRFLDQLRRLRRVSKRAIRLSTSTITMRVSAPAQARSMAVLKGDCACWNTKRGNDDCAPLNGLVLIRLLPNEVSSSGAVSPVTRA